METLAEEFKDPDMLYGPFMFWFWDAPLEASNPVEMAKRLLEQNINPGYAHPRVSMVDEPEEEDPSTEWMSSVYEKSGINVPKSLTGLDPREEWLSEEWFELFGETVDATEEMGGRFSYCDEFWWPSMQAAGRVVEEHPELEAEYLQWRTIDVPADQTIDIPSGFAAVAAPLAGPLESDGAPIQTDFEQQHSPRRIASENVQRLRTDQLWTAEGRPHRVYVFEKFRYADSPSYIDERLADAFIEIALEPYAEHLSDAMGTTMPGDFIDNEGMYGHLLAWSEDLCDRYEAEYGVDIVEDLPLLVDEDPEGRYARARIQWFSVVSSLYAENFQRVTDWHEERDMYTTAHFWEETLAVQARWVGSHFEMQRALSIPGQDALGDVPMSIHHFKEAQSVSEFEGGRFMTEFMGAATIAGREPYTTTGEFSGEYWETFVPHHIKRFSNAIFAWGASHVIPCGLFMTRTLEGNPWTPDWYEQNPMFPQLHHWADFTRRASYMNSNGDQEASVLVINPIETIWSLSGYELFDESLFPRHFQERWHAPEVRESGKRINAINEAYVDIIETLAQERVEYLLADTHYLEQMEVEDGRLVRGDRQFSTVVLPPMDVIPRSIAETFLTFAETGGEVYYCEELPSGSVEAGADDPDLAPIMDQLSRESTVFQRSEISRLVGHPGLGRSVEIEGDDFALLSHHRVIDGHDVIWIANNSGTARSPTLRFPDVSGRAQRWHPESGSIDTIGSQDTADGAVVDLRLDPYEAFWLVFDPEEPPHDGTAGAQKLHELTVLDGEWEVSIDPDDQPPLEHPVEVPSWLREGGSRALESWHREWDLNWNFSGRIDYRTSFQIEDPSEEVWLDLGRVQWAADVWVNGQHVGDSLWPPHRVRVDDALTDGNNDLEIRIANLVNNNYGEYKDSGLLGPVRLLQP